MPLRLRACTADGKYRSAVIEMLSMKDNAKAVPRLSKVSILALQAQPCGYASLDVTASWCADVSLGNILRQAMYEEWIDKQSFLRQADRMVARVRHR